ncbi:LPS export ABC transporter periplasmic protein LptC [Halomonas sp. Bachu 37]|uniref:LPS export ABC transporter periplasmic protein LptC n=1 Tax=Halomonas kashgarensis TaxID=3084920 RepID=UPI003216A8F2
MAPDTPSRTRTRRLSRHFTRRLGLGVLILALGGLLVYLDPGEQRQPGVDLEARANEPGHILEGAELTLFGNDGHVRQAIRTPRMTHSQEDISQAEQPRARLFDSHRREWTAEAEQGFVDVPRQQLTLTGDARLRAPEAGWQLDTQILHYDAQQAHAWSETPALLQQPPQRMQANRMDAWLNESRVRLTDDVKGYHPPETNAQEEMP